MFAAGLPKFNPYFNSSVTNINYVKTPKSHFKETVLFTQIHGFKPQANMNLIWSKKRSFLTEAVTYSAIIVGGTYGFYTTVALYLTAQDAIKRMGRISKYVKTINSTTESTAARNSSMEKLLKENDVNHTQTLKAVLNRINLTGNGRFLVEAALGLPETPAKNEKLRALLEYLTKDEPLILQSILLYFLDKGISFNRKLFESLCH